MDYNRVQIEDLHLTADGTSMGQPCRVEIPSLARLRPAFRRTLVLPIEGPPVAQLFPNLIGEQLQLTIFVVNKDEYEDLIEIIDTADEGTGLINIKLSDGAYGEFDLECMLESFDQPTGEFTDERIPGLVTVWRIAEVNEIEEEEEE